MPSGGHGGSHGGGGHFGGGSSGSSGGGSHFGGGRSSNRKTANRNGTKVYMYSFFGRTYYMNTGSANKVSALIVILAVVAFLSIVFFALPFDYDYRLQTIESDHDRYIQMINNAKEDSNYYIEGKVTSYYCFEDDEDCEKYYVNYSFTVTSSTTGNPLTIEGYSYSIYSYFQAYSLYQSHASGGFGIATDTNINEINEENYLTVDSVNMDYENFGLMDDYEYSNAHTIKTIVRVARIILLIVIPTVITALVVSLSKNFKKDEGETSTLDNTSGQEQVEKTNDETQNNQNKNFKSKKCKYCGSTLVDGETKCRNCGGSRWE